MSARGVVVVLAFASGSIGCGDHSPAHTDGAVNGSNDAGVDAGGDAGVAAQACRDGWCWMWPKPQGSDLTALWGFSATDVWSVGRHGAIVHYDGNEWTEYAPPASNNADLFAAFGVAPTDLWAGGQGALYHWNGSAWSTVDDVGLGTVFAIGGGATNDVWVAGGLNVRQWDGNAVMVRPSPALSGQRLLGFWSSGGATYTVSNAGGIAKWLGSAWGVSDAGNHPGNAAAFVSPTQIVLAGDNGAVWFYDGNSWTSHATPQTATWTSVAATSLTDVWVSDGVRVSHWDGGQWTPAGTGTGGVLWIDPTGAPWIASWAKVLSWTGSAWMPRTTGEVDIMSVGGTADDDLWVTTTNPSGVPSYFGGTRHWNGAAWTDVPSPAAAAGCQPGDVWAAATDDVWVALACRPAGTDDFQARRLMHWNGNDWSLVESLGFEYVPGGIAGFNAVWGSAANNVYAAADTAVFHFDGMTWSQVMNGPPGGGAVFGVGANDVYVLHLGDLWHWNGTQWRSRTAPSRSALTSGLQTAADSVWLGGTSDGDFFDGQFFVQTSFLGQPVGTAGDVFVQEYGTLSALVEAHYQGGFSGTRTETPTFFRQGAGWRSPAGSTYVVDRDGCEPGCGFAGGGLLVHGP